MIQKEGKVWAVSMGEMVVSNSPDDTLVAYGLGSCIGLTFFDPSRKVGGMAHIMLPEAPTSPGQVTHPAKFATHAVAALLEEMGHKGCARTLLVCKLVGGAQMLAGRTDTDLFRIGERNAETVMRELKKAGVRVATAETGGKVGRTLQLFVGSGRVTMRAVGQPTQDL